MGDTPIEQATAQELMKLPHTFRVINGIKKGPTRSDVEHLIIGPTGVWVIGSCLADGEFGRTDGRFTNGTETIDELSSHVEEQAKYTTDLLGFDANPIVCFVNAKLPRPAQMVGRVRAVELDALAGYISAGQSLLMPLEIKAHVERVSDWRRPTIRYANAPAATEAEPAGRRIGRVTLPPIDRDAVEEKVVNAGRAIGGVAQVLAVVAVIAIVLLIVAVFVAALG